ncbi:uncharacterized protein TNCV_3810881 [Trichonephila clavipes]|nr:uncharacterized protein TNCV_3810881 [Trichonephila clavipes]
MSTELGKLIGIKLSFQMNHASICGNHDGRISVRCSAGERCLLECVIEWHSCLTPRIMVWDAILYPERCNLLRVEGDLNRNRSVREVLYSPKSLPSFKA